MDTNEIDFVSHPAEFDDLVAQSARPAAASSTTFRSARLILPGSRRSRNTSRETGLDTNRS